MIPSVSRRRGLSAVGISCALVLCTSALSSDCQAEVRFFDPDGRELPFRTYKQVEEFLSTADIVWKEKLAAGTNKSKRKVLLQRDGVKAHAIHRTGYEIKASPGGGFVDSYLSELAAYELSKLLGLDNVPPVVRRKGGSIQIWIENATTDAARRKAGREPEDPTAFERQLQVMHVFDNLIANTDRNPGNIVIDSSGKVWFVDHTRSFAGQRELKYPEKITGCSQTLWERLQSVSEAEIRQAVALYAKTYISELLLRRRLLLDEIAQRIQSQGNESFIFVPGS